MSHAVRENSSTHLLGSDIWYISFSKDIPEQYTTAKMTKCILHAAECSLATSDGPHHWASTVLFQIWL